MAICCSRASLARLLAVTTLFMADRGNNNKRNESVWERKASFGRLWHEGKSQPGAKANRRLSSSLIRAD